MSGRVLFVVGNFTLDPDAAEFRFKRAANCPGQFRDGEDLGCRGAEEVGSHRLSRLARINGPATTVIPSDSRGIPS